MMRKPFGRGVMLASVLLACSGLASGADSVVKDPETMAKLQAAAPGVRTLELAGRLSRVYGVPMAQGLTPELAARSFIDQYASIFGVAVEDLAPWSLPGNATNVQPLMPEADGTYRFNLVTYSQTADGIPVFKADLRVLTRSAGNNEVVWVGNALIDLAGFVPDQAVAANPRVDLAVADAELRLPKIRNGRLTPADLVIWGGLDGKKVTPKLAVVFEAETREQEFEAGYGKWQIVADAATGKMLYSESLVKNVDVSGRTSGIATTGIKAAECNTETDTALPYTLVTIGGLTAFADASGNYTVTGVPAGSYTVSAGPRGRFFDTYDPTNRVAVTSSTDNPNVQLNSDNANEVVRAGVNAYYHANVVRDMVTTANPAYPTIGAQTNFRINVAVAGTCNAFYNGSSINFYNAGGGCNNTAFFDVVHHEYGHHVVNTGGSGQGQYGEGTGDCMGVLLSDQPILGFGFQSCASGIRTANNTLQYPQDPNSVPIHTAGQLISGCVWSTRNAMVAAGTPNYSTILKRLCINAVPMHSGSTIAPDITVDWMTLDDTDGNINNGTPNYQTIQTGFSAHNMAGPTLTLLDFSFPNGLPTSLSPNAPTSVLVNVIPISGTPAPNSGTLTYRFDSGADTTISMTPLGGNQYMASIPGAACGTTVTYSFAATTTGGSVVRSPSGAPASGNTALATYGNVVRFADNFQTNTGWTVTNDAALTDGAWQRGIPVAETDATRRNAVPLVDQDGSGQCYLTANRIGNSDVDAGTTTLTSPNMDASGPGASISYARWYSNNLGGAPEADTFVVQTSGNGGASWTTLETVGPSGVENRGGWRAKSFPIPAAQRTNQFRIRFVASDLATGSLVEAAIDAVNLSSINCTPPNCPADFNGDGFLDGFDYDDYVNCFEGVACPPGKSSDFNNDGFTDGFDYDEFVAVFQAGC